jgi:DNA-binding transcriptional MerR regulator
LSRETASGRLTPGLRPIIDHPLGPTLRQLDYWVSLRLVHPVRRNGPRAYGSRFTEEQQTRAINIARLVRRGFTAEGAAAVLDCGETRGDGSFRGELPDGVIIELLPPDKVVT